MKLRFGDFLLDRSTGSLTGPDGPVPLRRQTYRLLEVLLEHAPGLVDHDTLLDEAWGHPALSPNVLPQAISELRQALGDSANDPEYIETLHRRGYRIIPEVEQVDEEPDSSPVSDHSGQRSSDRTRLRGLWMLAALTPLVLFALWWHHTADQRWLENDALPRIEKV